MKSTELDKKLHQNSLAEYDKFVSKVYQDAEKKGLLVKISEKVDKVKDVYSTYLGTKFEQALHAANFLEDDPKQFKALSKNPSDTVRRAIMENPNTPFSVLLSMYRDKENKSFFSAINIAAHPSTPSNWVLHLMSEIKKDYELEELLYKKDLPIRVLEVLAYERSGNYASIVDGFVDVQQEAKDILVERLDKLKTARISDSELKEVAVKSKSKTELYAVVLNGGASIDTLKIVDSKLLSYGVDIANLLDKKELEAIRESNVEKKIIQPMDIGERDINITAIDIRR